MTQDYTMRYMTRFHCIGTACENNCCWGWRILVDKENYDKLKLATRRSREERERFEKSIVLVKKSQRHPGSYAEIKLRPDQTCPMLDNGLCHIHLTFGEDYLSNTCSTYPRKVKRAGKARELTGLVSCPQVARLLLLAQDAVDLVPFDRSSLPRESSYQGYDPRDSRPYWRHLMEVRDWVLRLVQLQAHTLDERLFLVTYFAKRTTPFFHSKLTSGDPEPLHREMHTLEDQNVRNEVARRFDAFETPHSLVVLLAREILRVGARHDTRTSLREMTRAVFESYAPEDWAKAQTLETDPKVLDSIPTRDIWPEYRRRKARILEQVGERVEQYWTNFTAHYWVHNWHVDSPDLLVHMLRLLGEMAIQKFLFFSHPQLQTLLDDYENAGSEKSGAEAARKALIEGADRVAVEVFHKAASFIEHGTLLKNFEHSLEKAGLKSLAGAVYLVKF